MNKPDVSLSRQIGNGSGYSQHSMIASGTEMHLFEYSPHHSFLIFPQPAEFIDPTGRNPTVKSYIGPGKPFLLHCSGPLHPLADFSGGLTPAFLPPCLFTRTPTVFT
jgi:hypothetical protein